MYSVMSLCGATTVKPIEDRNDLALTLFVAWVIADDHDPTVTTNDLALIANLLDAGVYLHDASFIAVLVPHA